jgi:hypothetical protein
LEDFDPFFPRGVDFRIVAPDLCHEICSYIADMGYLETALELNKLNIPLQKLNGNEDSFSCMAYAVPKLTLEERQQRELRNSQSISVKCCGGLVKLDLDDFGKICWLWATGLPSLYWAIRSHFQAIKPHEEQAHDPGT